MAAQRVCQGRGPQNLQRAADVGPPGSQGDNVPGDAANNALAAITTDANGRCAAIVGVVDAGPVGVRLRTGLGTTRPLLMLTGDQLPQIR